jgi:hypothetical protein
MAFAARAAIASFGAKALQLLEWCFSLSQARINDHVLIGYFVFTSALPAFIIPYIQQ